MCYTSIEITDKHADEARKLTALLRPSVQMSVSGHFKEVSDVGSSSSSSSGSSSSSSSSSSTIKIGNHQHINSNNIIEANNTDKISGIAMAYHNTRHISDPRPSTIASESSSSSSPTNAVVTQKVLSSAQRLLASG